MRIIIAMKEGTMMIATTDTDTVSNVFAERNMFLAIGGALDM
jgi:hypothetical protein